MGHSKQRVVEGMMRTSQDSKLLYLGLFPAQAAQLNEPGLGLATKQSEVYPCHRPTFLDCGLWKLCVLLSTDLFDIASLKE